MTLSARAFVAAVVAACLLTPAVALAAKARPAWVIPESLNVRSGPGTERKKIGTLSRGDKVHVTAFANKWCWAKLPDGSWGWIAEWLLQFSANKGRALAAEAKTSSSGSRSASPTVAWVKESAVNVRSGPGLGYSRYGTLPKGRKVYITDRKSGWCRVSTGNGFGWILGELLEYNVNAGRRLAAAATSGTPVSRSTSSSAGTAKGFVVGSVVNLRKGPGTKYDPVGLVVQGQTLYITETKGDWCKATVHGGNSGWISRALVKYADTPAAPKPAAVASRPSGDRFQQVPAWVSEEIINVRASASRDSDIRFQLERGAKVTAIALDGHWVQVKTSGGRSGWAAGWVVSFVPPGQQITAQEGSQTVKGHVGWVARPRVNLRAEPSSEAEKIASAELSTRVVILNQQGQWYKVAMDSGEVGWMASWLVDTRAQRIARKTTGQAPASASGIAEDIAFPSPTTTASAGGIGQEIQAAARKFVGHRYVRGSASPGSGVDCSGFVHYVMKQFGVSLPRSCDAQFRNGQPVSRSALQPGDVVFFQNTYRRGISHVGFYVGDDKFVHASNSRRGVVIDSLNSSYYAPRYYGARRMY